VLSPELPIFDTNSLDKSEDAGVAVYRRVHRTAHRLNRSDDWEHKEVDTKCDKQENSDHNKDQHDEDDRHDDHPNEKIQGFLRIISNEGVLFAGGGKENKRDDETGKRNNETNQK